jgi:hypothetical protein
LTRTVTQFMPTQGKPSHSSGRSPPFMDGPICAAVNIAVDKQDLA